jgi:hypothetical protein
MSQDGFNNGRSLPRATQHRTRQQGDRNLADHQNETGLREHSMRLAITCTVSVIKRPVALPAATLIRRSLAKVHDCPATTNAIAAQAQRVPNAIT